VVTTETKQTRHVEIRSFEEESNLTIEKCLKFESSSRTIA
jgi:hypothetical protein